jgi:hypothetical protein
LLSCLLFILLMFNGLNNPHGLGLLQKSKRVPSVSG